MSKLPPVSEHSIQSNFFKEANFEFRNDPTWIPELFYAVLHGAWIAGEGDSAQEKSRRKSGLISKYIAEGWKSGIPDMMYDQPRGSYNKLVIEFKRADRRNEKNGGLSDDQLKYMNAVAPYAKVVVCYSEDEAMQALREYMGITDDIPSWKPELRLQNFHRQFHHDLTTCEICSNLE